MIYTKSSTNNKKQNMNDYYYQRHCANCAHFEPSKSDRRIGDCWKFREPVYATDLQCDKFEEFVYKKQN